MLSKADKQFEELVLRVFQKYQGSLELNVRKQTETHLDVEVRIPSLGNVGFRVVATSTSTQRTQVEDDPRGFGDAQHVVAAAMHDWYPGKTSSWTVARRSVIIQAWNLPSPAMRDYTATYEYDPENANNKWAEAYEAEQAYQLVMLVKKTQAMALVEAREKEYADRLVSAFSGLLAK